ncbi:MAG: hypothetical protein QG578_309 [Thermodesulfobacteriota bacterium]|nr:hypothetical protein [Thermodesulfobacteriota bacterium]
MKFKLLLFILAQKLKAAAKKNTAYRKHLGIMQIRVLINAADCKAGLRQRDDRSECDEPGFGDFLPGA